MASKHDRDLQRYAEELHQGVLLEAEIEGSEQLRSEVFTQHVIDILIEAGELEEALPCHHRDRGIEVHGYGIDDHDTLNLICTIFAGDPTLPSVAPGEVTKAFKRLLTFWERASTKAYHEQLEESSDAYDMALHVKTAAPGIRRIRLFVIADGTTKAHPQESEQVGDLEIRRAVWDIERLFRLETSGQTREPIAVDFLERYGQPLPCLAAGTGHEDYDAMLAVFPGQWLADIYNEYGPRLLELNVRSFLQAAGKVNRGIRDTLRDEPGRFLAYNNGISATASKVEFVELPGGGRAIARVRDLQIVNGGQTTASIHRALVGKLDLSEVSVQAKITVVAPENLDAIVPLISRYANSQNKVSEADLTSNDPFHVEIEELSRTIWTPTSGDGLRQTKWFYERARGQYRDALSREGTPARQKAWKIAHPPNQKFTKTDLAKFANTWDLRPHDVSRGAQKNFTIFMGELARNKTKPSPEYFQRLIAKAILWKRAEILIRDQGYGGYRANLVAYSLAKLSHATSQRVDLDRIWEAQGLDAAHEQAIVDLSRVAWGVLVDQAPSGANITEWAKRERCWELMRAESWEVPAAVQVTLKVLGGGGPASSGATNDSVSDDPAVIECLEVKPDEWFALSNWAKQTGNLQPWHRKLAYDIGIRISRGRPPSIKQATHGSKILAEARERGFTP